MRVVKLLGLVDILAAIVIFTNANIVLLNLLLFIILIVKGIPSLGADWAGKFYGVIDIVTAFVILFGLNLGLVESLLILVLLFKGVTSLL